MATLALFVTLGGSSYAAIRIGSREIRDNSVRGADLRKGSVSAREVREGALTGGDIRDRALGGEDVRSGGLTGAQMAPDSLGSREVQNLRSSDFAPGQFPAPAPSRAPAPAPAPAPAHDHDHDPLPATLPPGKTLTGTFASAVTGGDGDSGISRASISFPLPLAERPAGQAYQVAGAAPTALCPGTPADPRAAPGVLCVYEAALVGTVTLRGFFDPVTGENFRSSRFGTVAFVNGEAGAAIRGTWAVTAP